MDKLIDQLANANTKRQSLLPISMRAVHYALFALIYYSINVTVIGLRPDVVSALTTLHMGGWSMQALALFLAGILSLFSALTLSVPGRSKTAIYLFLSAGVFLFAGLYPTLEMAGHELMVHHDHQFDWHSCLLKSTVLFAAPMAALTYLTHKKARPTQFVLQAIVNSVTVFSFGYVAIRLSCGIDAFWHDFIYHIAPYTLFGLIGGFISARYLKW